jgi:Ohr subfamily peroxiredoxin
LDVQEKERAIMTKPLFTSSVTAIGGREGRVQSSEGNLAWEIAMPGTPKKKNFPEATNPEQLFAAGYSACFDSALQLIARKERISFESEVTANVSLLKDEEDQGFKLAVTLQVKGIGADRDILEELVRKAHAFCPYSKATRGNITVELEVIE